MIDVTIDQMAGQIDAAKVAPRRRVDEILLAILPVAGIFSVILAIHVGFALATANALSASGVCTHRNASGIAYMPLMMH